MWNNIKNFLEKLVGTEVPLSENKTEKLEPKIKQIKKANYRKKAKSRL